MLPHASAVHLAEVLMSGLLKVSGTEVPTFENAERIAYELVDEEVRDRLRAGLRVGDALDVLAEVSQYIARGLGKSTDEFWALLRTPAQGESSAETEFLNAFATVRANILRGLGGDWVGIANSLAPPEIAEEADSLHNFPPLQSCEYASATIAAILDRFDFETAKLERETRSKKRSQWIVRRRRAATWGYTERLSSATREDIGLEMITIPGGSFAMGAPESEPENGNRERPQHQVTLAPFYLGRYPVTQAQWRVVAGYDAIDRELNPDPSNFKGDDRPVENVSWDDAREFCQRLSAKTGKDYRLPSEAQWEYACRAGTETPFHFGDTLSTELANYDGNYRDPSQCSAHSQRLGGW
ncbi:MAG TPA: formylglycine-generating enzyme family protein [Oscillatoriales cyanobacterium M59_W2019_021]|nr:MAG: formylglycine-generating enzyme family protein [Cyanobacteria bacterium J055]HIK33044.1 formylglycine-generating enzyme family protein [Oscillatoriales cyanobacterium M4454_W2019_049]HIK52721.1 formylglycine-generating enzyme family protein [Oscillatoriales cyanobacterium M59_W2019_021]